jgi:hypothetical protein
MSEFRDSRRDSSSYHDAAAAAGSSSALAIHDSTASAASIISKAESSVLSSSNVKTPSRSFYHRAFHGSLGKKYILDRRLPIDVKSC